VKDNYQYVDPDYTYTDPKTGFILNLNPPDNAGVYERYMSGTIEGDVDKLVGLIEELIERINLPAGRQANDTNVYE
jgi:hypothetical protein